MIKSKQGVKLYFKKFFKYNKHLQGANLQAWGVSTDLTHQVLKQG